MNQNQRSLRFEKRVKELASTDVPDLWKAFKDGVIKACDEMGGTKKSGKYSGDMWWWNEEVKRIIAKKKSAFGNLCRSPPEDNTTQYKRIRNQTKKFVARAMRYEAEHMRIICVRIPTVFQLSKKNKKRKKKI